MAVDTAWWDSCPYCESNEVEGGFVEINGIAAIQNLTCLECERSWTDVYEAAYRIDDGGETLIREEP